jgi:hypothetical protein
MKTGTQRGWSVAVAVLGALIAIAGGEAVAQSPAAPHPLLGRWDGEFKNQYATGDYSVSVKSIEGDKASGTLRPGGNCPYCGKDIPFTGQVSPDGDVLTFSGVTPTNTSFRGELRRKGDELVGWGQGAVKSDLALRRVK